MNENIPVIIAATLNKVSFSICIKCKIKGYKPQNVYFSPAEIMIPEYFAASPGTGKQNNIILVKKTTASALFYLNFAVCITGIPLHCN